MAEIDENMDSLEPKDPEIEYGGLRDFDVHYYGTGSTKPPRDYLNMMSALFSTTILLCGAATLLGLLGIQLLVEPAQTQTQEEEGVFIRFEESGRDTTLGLEFSAAQDQGQTADAGTETWQDQQESLTLQISSSPQGLENTAEQTQAMSWQQVYQKMIPSVVSITCSTGSTTCGGSGVIMTSGGYILTNAHVVEDSEQIQVLLTDGRTFQARIIGLDEQSDLAVIDIDASGLTPAEFGDSGTLQVGDEVVAIGDPLGIELRGTMTDGIISGISRDLQVGNRTMTLIQTTAALNSGNSGGPLVNCYGQVVGINTMKLTGTETSVEGLGFAIPSATIQTIVQQLVTQGYVSGRPTLGVEGAMLSSFYQHYYRLPAGLLVSQVEEDSDAYTQGIRSGDIILYINDNRIISIETYEELIFSHDVGDRVTVTIYRNGREYDIPVILVEDHH